MARLRHALSDWRTYIVLAYLALALVSLSLYRSVQESREADRAAIVSNASRHLANCHEVEGVKTGIRLFLREVAKLNRELDGRETPDETARACKLGIDRKPAAIVDKTEFRARCN